MSWEQFTASLSRAFSNEYVFTIQNISLFTLVVLICLIIVFIIRYDAIRSDVKRRIAYQETQKFLRKKRRLSQDGNKRDWYRMEIELPFQWYPLSLADSVTAQDFYQGVAIDISGGGLLFQTEKISTLDEQIQILLPIDGKTLELTGQVVRAQAEEIDGINCYLAGVKFINIREGQRDKIVSWIMKLQAEELLEQKEQPTPELVTEDPDPELTSLDQSVYLKKIWEKLLTEQNITFSGIWQADEIDLIFKLENEELMNLKGVMTASMAEEKDDLTINLKIYPKQ